MMMLFIRLLFYIISFFLLSFSSTTVGSEADCLAVPTVKLHNGIEMPLLQLGVCQLITQTQEDLPRFIGMLPERAYRQMELALQSGIRAFDTVSC